ncbi:MAG: tol-pal system-associated acyl-CoA thioesterase [Alphaproteobacteria bacterium]|nr:tol-pal system-associated acyl-CoA thioesterase [Alphaproteobacteria bacterium]
MTETYSGLMKEKTFVFPLRVYYSDTDAGGVVYYANYLTFAEKARTEMIRLFGWEHRTAMESAEKQAFVVRHCEIDYRRSAKLDDLLEIHTMVTKIKGASMNMEQRIQLDGKDIVVLSVKLACITMDGKPARIPVVLRDKLLPYVKCK